MLKTRVTMIVILFFILFSSKMIDRFELNGFGQPHPVTEWKTGSDLDGSVGNCLVYSFQVVSFSWRFDRAAGSRRALVGN